METIKNRDIVKKPFESNGKFAKELGEKIKDYLEEINFFADLLETAAKQGNEQMMSFRLKRLLVECQHLDLLLFKAIKSRRFSQLSPRDKEIVREMWQNSFLSIYKQKYNV